MWNVDLRQRQHKTPSSINFQFGMPANLTLNAVAFISPQNHPIFIRTFSKQNEHAIKYHYVAHTSLDVIEERGQHHFGCAATVYDRHV
jgi:hypothetical protein